MSTVSNTSAASSAAAQVAAANAAAQAAQTAAAQSHHQRRHRELDTGCFVLTSALVNAKIAGQAGALTAETNSDNTQISAFGTLSAALSAMQTALQGLANGNDLSQFTATASGTGLTATTAAGCGRGQFPDRRHAGRVQPGPDLQRLRCEHDAWHRHDEDLDRRPVDEPEHQLLEQHAERDCERHPTRQPATRASRLRS